MRQYSENKSSSAAPFIIMTAVALVGFSAIAVRSGRLNSYMRQKKNNDKVKIELLDSQIDAIVSENTTMRQDLKLLSATLDRMAIQNEELHSANKALSIALEEEHERVMKLMNIITEETEEKLILTQRLEEANRKLAIPAEDNSKVFIA